MGCGPTGTGGVLSGLAHIDELRYFAGVSNLGQGLQLLTVRRYQHEFGPESQQVQRRSAGERDLSQDLGYWGRQGYGPRARVTRQPNREEKPSEY